MKQTTGNKWTQVETSANKKKTTRNKSKQLQNKWKHVEASGTKNKTAGNKWTRVERRRK